MRKKLTDLCTIQYGYAFNSESFTTDDSFPPLVRIRDVKRGFSETFYSGEYPPEYVIHFDDLLIGMDGEFNIARWKSADALLNQRVCKITATCGTVEEYLRFALQKALKEIEDRTAFVTVKHLSAKELNKLELEIPDIGEQARIAQILCKLERVIFKRETELSALDDLIKARFVEMFGDPEYNNKRWPLRKLTDLCTIGSSKRIYQGEQTMDGIPFWRISDLVAKMDTGNVDSTLYIPESRYEELKCQGLVPEPGDILVTSRGTLGRCYIISPEDRFYFQDGMISWLSHYTDEITPLYIQYLFDMPGFKKQIDSMRAGSTVAYLSIAMLKKLDIMLPSKEAQVDFSAFVAQIDKSKSVIQKSLDETQLLFDSLMQEYFG